MSMLMIAQDSGSTEKVSWFQGTKRECALLVQWNWFWYSWRQILCVAATNISFGYCDCATVGACAVPYNVLLLSLLVAFSLLRVSGLIINLVDNAFAHTFCLEVMLAWLS